MREDRLCGKVHLVRWPARLICPHLLQRNKRRMIIKFFAQITCYDLALKPCPI